MQCEGMKWNEELERYERCTNLVPPIALLHDDPFCSNVCAREAYGNPLPYGEATRGRPRAIPQCQISGNHAMVNGRCVTCKRDSKTISN